MIKIVGVRFRNAGKIYYFGPGNLDLTAGMHVIVETARGVECFPKNGDIILFKLHFSLPSKQLLHRQGLY